MGDKGNALLLGVHPTMLFPNHRSEEGCSMSLEFFDMGFCHKGNPLFGGNLMHENLPEKKCDERVSTHRVATSGELAHSANNKAPLPPSTSSRSIKVATMNSSCPPIVHNTKSPCS
jgi:hypothetical protein